MAVRGYTDMLRVIHHHNLTLTSAQVTEGLALIEAAEAYIDGATGMAWLMGAQTAEEHALDGRYLWLDYAPILASPAPVVTGYTSWADAGTVLTANTHYRVSNLATGEIDFGRGWPDYGLTWGRVTVSYTPSTVAPPAMIQLAATILVGFWLQQTISGQASGVKSYSVGGEESVTFQDVVAERGIPAEVASLIGARRLVVA